MLAYPRTGCWANRAILKRLGWAPCTRQTEQSLPWRGACSEQLSVVVSSVRGGQRINGWPSDKKKIHGVSGTRALTYICHFISGPQKWGDIAGYSGIQRDTINIYPRARVAVGRRPLEVQACERRATFAAALAAIRLNPQKFDSAVSRNIRFLAAEIDLARTGI